MKQTLLELTQDILSSLGSDEVNSISDTVESLQVANIIKAAYFDIIYRANLPEHFSIIGLEASTDNTKPVVMTVPTTVNKILWVKYDAREAVDDVVLMKDVKLVTLDELLMYTYNADPDADNVDSMTYTLNGTDFTFFYFNDRAPSYYAAIDDYTLLFDGYNAALDTTLQKSKSMVLARLEPTFTLTDSFTPSLDSEQFNLLVNEAKSLAWMELKQSGHNIAERNSRRAWVHQQKNKSKSGDIKDFDKLAYYGRK